MKKKILGVLIVLSMFLVSASAMAAPLTTATTSVVNSNSALISSSVANPSTSVFSIPKSVLNIKLKLGSKNSNVINLQQLLINKGYLKAKTTTNYFGPSTLAAVRAFQTENKLTPDGVVGLKTFTLLGSQNTSVSKAVVTNPVLTRICIPTTAPWLQITSPDGGETYTAGQQITVTWKSCNIVGDVIIQLEMPTMSGNPGIQLAPTLLGGSPNDGQEVVTLPSSTSASWPNMVYGNNFKIEITGLLHTSLDYSDSLFTIKSLI